MAVRPANLRISKWIAKMQGEALSVVTGRQKESMTEQIQQEFPRLETLENEIKVILGEAGLATILNPSYLNFGRQVYKSCRKFSGGQLLYNADVLLNRWVGEGLDRDILERVRNTVFELTAPTP